MKECELITYQRVYTNKAIYKFIKHTEHYRTEEYICTTEEGDIYIEQVEIIDDKEVERKVIPLVKANIGRQ